MSEEACSNFQFSLTGGFQTCRHCGREKKEHNLSAQSTVEYKKVQNPFLQNQQKEVQPQVPKQQVQIGEISTEGAKISVKERAQMFQQNTKNLSSTAVYVPKNQLNKTVSNVPKKEAEAVIISEPQIKRGSILEIKEKYESTAKNQLSQAFKPSGLGTQQQQKQAASIKAVDKNAEVEEGGEALSVQERIKRMQQQKNKQQPEPVVTETKRIQMKADWKKPEEAKQPLKDTSNIDMFQAEQDNSCFEKEYNVVKFEHQDDFRKIEFSQNQHLEVKAKIKLAESSEVQISMEERKQQLLNQGLPLGQKLQIKSTLPLDQQKEGELLEQEEVLYERPLPDRKSRMSKPQFYDDE